MTPARVAALAYFVYGVVYLSGAILELDESRRRNFFGDTIPWWVFYIIGGLFVLGLPLLVAKGIRWLMWVLAFFTAVKALYLFYRLGSDFYWFNLMFAVVALAATITLARAASMKQSASG